MFNFLTIEINSSNEHLFVYDGLQTEERFSQVSKRSLLTNDLRIWVERFVMDQPNQDKLMESAPERTELVFGDDYREDVLVHRYLDVFYSRILENTDHPSQILPRELKDKFSTKLAKIRSDHRAYMKRHPEGWGRELIARLAMDVAEEIMREVAHQIDDLQHAYIAANSKLPKDSVSELRRQMRDLRDFTNPSDIADSFGMDLTSLNLTDFNAPMDFVFDEVKEKIIHAKTALLSGPQALHSIWIDFDGAKRPEGIMFSIFGGLVFADIQKLSKGKGRRKDYLSDDGKQRALSTYSDFLKTDVLIHSLTGLLKDNHLPHKEGLEKLMVELKRRRLEDLKELVRFRNVIEARRRRRTRQGQDHMDVLFVSKQVNFLPRLDHNFIEAELDVANGDQPNMLSDEDRVKYRSTFGHIVEQIKDMKTLSNLQEYKENGHLKSLRDQSPVHRSVVQVMIANAEGAQDAIVLDGCLSGHEDIAISLLFEGKDTTDPVFIEDCLERLYEAWPLEKFKKRCSEVFFAGSDLSKDIGQLAGLVRVRNAALAIERFNERHPGADVRVKLGSGEALFRQLGFLDPDGYLPAIRGKVEDPREMTEQVIQDQAFLAGKFGDDWREKLIRKPSGFHWLLERHPWINGFTMQSRGKEQTFFIEPSRLVRLMEDLCRLHQRNFSEEHREESFAETPDYLQQAADAEEAFYSKIMGTPEDEHKPGGDQNFHVLNFPNLVQIFSKQNAMLRDRGLSRTSDVADFASELDSLLKRKISSRAIGTNTASTYTFMLGLLGKGSVLQQASDAGTLENLLYYIPLKPFLKAMKLYEVIAPSIFEMMEEYDLPYAKDLKEEWGRLLEFRPVLQEAYFDEIVSCTDQPVSWESGEREYFISRLSKSQRELLDDSFSTVHSSSRKI